MTSIEGPIEADIIVNEIEPHIHILENLEI